MGVPRRDPQSEFQDTDDDAEGTMGFLDHLDELRSRLIRSCIAVALGMLVA